MQHCRTRQAIFIHGILPTYDACFSNGSDTGDRLLSISSCQKKSWNVP
ncbi:MAG: hypothetical protein ACI9S8_002691, partial [Chlamydiales bacterium]